MNGNRIRCGKSCSGQRKLLKLRLMKIEKNVIKKIFRFSFFSWKLTRKNLRKSSAWNHWWIGEEKRDLGKTVTAGKSHQFCLLFSVIFWPGFVQVSINDYENCSSNFYWDCIFRFKHKLNIVKRLLFCFFLLAKQPIY